MLNETRWSLTPLRVRCFVFGHDDTLAREPNRLFLRCGTCGRHTCGWTIGQPPEVPPVRTSFATVTSGSLQSIRAVRPVF